MKLGEKIEDVIQKTTHDVLNRDKKVELPDDIIETDNLGEVIEKL